MPDLDQQLRSYLDALADDAIGRAEEHDQRADRSDPQRARRWPWVTLAAGVAAAALVFLGFLATSDDPSGQDVEVGPADRTAPEVSTDLPSVTGEWRQFRPTIAPGFELSPFVAALDDDHVLVLYLENHGGDVAGEILDLRAGTAEPIAAGPLGWRAFPMVGWTGDEVIVAGGSSGPGIDVAGAAYDPSTDSWREIAEPPGFERGISDNQAGGPGVVWTGSELISWQSGLAYNPETDTWRRIAPSPLAPRIDEATAAVHGGILVWGGCDPIEVPHCDEAPEAPFTDGALYDPATDSWTMLPEGPLGGGAGTLAVATTWDDQAIVVVPHPQDPGAPTVAAIDPTTLEWQELAPLPEGAGKRASSLVWTGTHIIAWGGYTGPLMTETDAGFMLNPVLGQWQPLPAGGRARRGHAALWTSHGLLIAGGSPTAQPTLFTPTR